MRPGCPVCSDSMVKRAEWEKSLDILSLQLNSLSRGERKLHQPLPTHAWLILSPPRHTGYSKCCRRQRTAPLGARGETLPSRLSMLKQRGGMTEQDKGIIPCIRLEQGWGDYSTIDYYSAIFQLAGHPFLFTDDSKQLKIEITRQDVEPIGHDHFQRRLQGSQPI